MILTTLFRIIRDLCSPPPPFPSQAEIDAKLDQIVKERGLKDNNHRESIVDLLKAIGQPSDNETREALYRDLGGEGKFEGTVGQNTWMIRQVRERFARGQID